MNAVLERDKTEAERRAENNGYLYPSDSPWAIFEGNYKGKIDWSDFRTGVSNKVMTSEEDLNVVRPATPMQNRKESGDRQIRRAPTGWANLEKFAKK